MPAVEDRFRLAGRAWKVVDIDEDKRVIQVEAVKGKAETYWSGGGATIHTRILQRIRRVLDEDSEYGYLQVRAMDRLQTARQLARMSELTDKLILAVGGSRFMLLPWQGTKVVNTINLLLEYAAVRVRSVVQPYYLEVEASNVNVLRKQIADLVNNVPSPDALIERLPPQALKLNKYDRYVPETLLRSAYALDRLDMSEAIASLNKMI